MLAIKPNGASNIVGKEGGFAFLVFEDEVISL